MPNPAKNQDVTIFGGNEQERGWNYWYPRGVVLLVSHSMLGPYAKTHYALRALYFVLTLQGIALDSVSRGSTEIDSYVVARVCLAEKKNNAVTRSYIALRSMRNCVRTRQRKPTVSMCNSVGF